MAEFDEAKFRSAAKAAGYSDEEINAELGTPAGSAPPLGMAAVPAIEQQFSNEFDAAKATLRKDYEKEKEEITTTSPFTLPGLLSSPTAWVAGGTALGALTTLAAPKIYKGIKERYMTKAPEIDRTIDIPTGGFFDVPPNPNVPSVDQPVVQAMDKLKRAEELAEANRQLGIGGNQPVPPTAPVAAPVAPPEPISTPISAAPIDAPAPTPSAKPNSFATETIVNEVKDMIQKTPEPVTGVTAQPAQQPVAPPQELRTGTGKPAFAGMGPAAELNKKGQPKFKPEYPGMEAVPSGYAFIPNAQYIDTPRQNIGQAEYIKAYTNRPFPLTNEQAIQESKEINRLLGRATRAENIAAGLPPAEITRGITQPINQPKGSGMGTKTVRVAGTVGALVAIPNVVNAAQQGNYGSAAVQAADIATDYLPFIGQIKQAFSPSSAGEGSSTVPSVDAAMLLGSPYAQTEIAKKRRQQEEYTRKVGAGRGIAPPSAYMR